MREISACPFPPSRLVNAQRRVTEVKAREKTTTRNQPQIKSKESHVGDIGRGSPTRQWQKSLLTLTTFMHSLPPVKCITSIKSNSAINTLTCLPPYRRFVHTSTSRLHHLPSCSSRLVSPSKPPPTHQPCSAHHRLRCSLRSQPLSNRCPLGPAAAQVSGQPGVWPEGLEELASWQPRLRHRWEAWGRDGRLVAAEEGE